jgi:hypothetical protein
MQQIKPKSGNLHRANFHVAAAVIAFVSVCFSGNVLAQQPGQKTFSSAQEATSARVTATKNNDEKTMLEILGSDGKQVVSSGDDAEDAENRANFVKRYEEMHRLMKEPDGETILYIGAHNWPTPIPLAHKGSVWFFDTEEGKREILYRRIGRNEISTIRVCQELAAAEKEYSAQHDGVFAAKIYSDEGQHDGLYWKVADGGPQSLIGPLVAAAVSEGYANGQNVNPTPYRGYYFHILTRQGKNAPGGAKSYSVNDKMTGFAFVAYPAEYRSSGVMTFIVGADGTVYQKDLGRKTEVSAKSMKEYNPDRAWEKAEGQQDLQTASEQTAADQTGK